MRESERATQKLCFGVFEVNLRTAELRKLGVRVRLPGQSFQVLEALLLCPGELVTREELKQKLWPSDSFGDFEHGLNAAVNRVREALGDSSDNPRFVETVPRRGYRFIAPVETLNRALEGASMTPRFSRVVEETATPSRAERSDHKQIRLKMGIAIVVPALLLFVAFALWRSEPHLPTVVSTIQITNDRKPKIPINGAVTDGLHLYFMEGEPWESGSGIAQVSTMGGETTWITTSLKNGLAILDISPDKSKLLLVAGVGDSDSDDFWVQPLPAGTPRRVGNFKARTVDWTPDGSHFIYSYQHKIGIVNEDGSDPHTIAEVPGVAAWFRYSPDGMLIRFSLLQNLENSSSIWEMRADGTNLHPLLPNWKESLDQCCGRWSPDGNYYYFLSSAFFLGGGGPSQAIWVMPEHRSIFREDIAPTRLTTGPLRFGAPTPSSDGKRIFAVGDESRVELFSYDPHAQRFDSYLGGIFAGPVSFSPDRKWVAYVSYPEMTLWKCRPDLSEKMQLTFPPVRAFLPRWSPDGSQIAFQNAQFHRPWKVYLVSPSGGGSPKQIAPSNIDDVDTDPTWTRDGKSIVFGRAPSGERDRQAIYQVDLSSGKLTLIHGSIKLFSPGLSPDGRYIAAFTADAKQLTLLDQTTNSWSTLAEGDHLGFNEWSSDGKYVYVQESVGEFAKIVRIRIRDRVKEDVLSLKNFPELTDSFAACYGLTPDGKLLLMRDRSVQEIYSLDLHFH